jgi:hypothetical protein
MRLITIALAIFCIVGCAAPKAKPVQTPQSIPPTQPTQPTEPTQPIPPTPPAPPTPPTQQSCVGNWGGYWYGTTTYQDPIGITAGTAAVQLWVTEADDCTATGIVLIYALDANGVPAQKLVATKRLTGAGTTTDLVLDRGALHIHATTTPSNDVPVLSSTIWATDGSVYPSGDIGTGLLFGGTSIPSPVLQN